VIVLARVDNRLLHGQILETWVPRFKIGRVVVADDEAAASALACAAMTLCIPPELMAEVVPVGSVDWDALAADPRAVLLLFREVASVVRAVEAGLRPEHVRRINLGNVHYAPGRRPVTPSVFLSGEELSSLAALEARGFEVEARAVPGDAPHGPKDLALKYDGAGDKR
jgi:N-acetylgalactosamine PTS system EIIB component